MNPGKTLSTSAPLGIGATLYGEGDSMDPWLFCLALAALVGAFEGTLIASILLLFGIGL